MILYEDPKVTVEYDPIIPCVIWTPLNHIFGDDFRNPLTLGMDFFVKTIKDQPNLGWLNDTRKQKSVKLDDVKWIDKNINDRAYQSGAKKVAFVLPENIFGRMGTRLYVEFTTQRPDNQLEIKAFKTLSEAKLWLKGAASAKLEDVKL